MGSTSLKATFENGVVTLCLDRPEAGNVIDAALIAALNTALDRVEREGAGSVVLRGRDGVFCTGADFSGAAPVDADALYALWQRLVSGPFVSISAVSGRVNAGGVGFVAACDIVLCDQTASFALSEMLFGIFPACVHPFLAQRIGHKRASHMALTTGSINAEQACNWGLVDAVADDLETLLAQHLRRVFRLDADAIGRYKNYLSRVEGADIDAARPLAVATNRALFADPQIRRNIDRYTSEMKFPWEP